MKNGKSRRNRRSTPITDEDKPETKLDRNIPDVETKGPTTPVRRNHDKRENYIIYFSLILIIQYFIFIHISHILSISFLPHLGLVVSHDLL